MRADECRTSTAVFVGLGARSAACRGRHRGLMSADAHRSGLGPPRLPSGRAITHALSGGCASTGPLCSRKHPLSTLIDVLVQVRIDIRRARRGDPCSASLPRTQRQASTSVIGSKLCWHTCAASYRPTVRTDPATVASRGRPSGAFTCDRDDPARRRDEALLGVDRRAVVDARLGSRDREGLWPDHRTYQTVAERPAD